jgi:ABC-2 type transport system ATP-binding protein
LQTVVALDQLSVCLGKREILTDLRVELFGHTIGLLGPNGAGKSTLILTLLGFYPITRGAARVLGHDIRRHKKKVNTLVGYMPENDSFIADMTAVSFVRMMGELSGLPVEAALERAHEVLFYVGLGEARYRKLGTYSVGMKQMVKLAQAIVHGPRLLILDEPTNGLDPNARRRMLHLIRDIRDSGQMHVLLCSHLLRDVEETCEEVLILKQGRIVHYANLTRERSVNQRFVEIETSDDHTKLVEDLTEIGCTCTTLGSRRLKMVLPKDFDLREIYRLTAKRNLPLRRLNYRQDTLEDIFLTTIKS